MSLRICVLASGSKANAVFLRSDETRILVDVGLGIRALPRVLQAIHERMEDISAVFITHEHTDHTRGLGRFLERSRAAVFASAGTLGCVDPVIPARCRTHALNGEASEFGPFVVRAIPVPHDAAEPVAFELLVAGQRIVVATDLGEVPAALQSAIAHASVAVLESNHDEELLRTGSYPELLKERIASETGHLSNRQTATALAACMGNGLTHAILAHISEENNKPTLARQSAEDALDGSGAVIHVTAQLTIGPMIDV